MKEYTKCFYNERTGATYTTLKAAKESSCHPCIYRCWMADEEIKAMAQLLYYGVQNGKEIYEGDILTAEYYPFMKDGKMNYIAVVGWFDYDACWYASMQLHRDSKARGISVDMPAWFDKDTAETYKVIGNIHDNPELIKEEQS